MYSHILSRPLSRALARIPNRAVTWNRDNLYVGRVATQHLSAVASTTSSASTRNDGFRFDPPIYHPPNSSSQTDNALSGYPFYKPPPPTYRLVVPYTSYPELVTTSTSRSAEVETEENIEPEPETTEPVPIIKVSSKIHIVGFDMDARFIAHSLAAVPNLPPVQMLTHHPKAMTKWGEEGRAIDIIDLETGAISSRNISCPNLIHEHKIQLGRRPILDNIILNTASGAAMPTLRRLRPFIDRRTTICLIQPGLGLTELLNERVFTVPELRPNYILGHSQHKLSRHSSLAYSLRHIPGQLLLHAVPRDQDTDLDWKTAIALGNQHTDHMIKLLSAAQDLNVVGLPWHLFLLQMLPDMIFQSLADTISVILGCRFDQIRNNFYAMSLWRKMVNETVQIVSLLPEFRDYPWIIHQFTKPSFRRSLRIRLEQNGTEYSRWISFVRKGQMPPVDFFNGYFIRRARDVGIEPTQNNMAVYLVKARQAGRHEELELAIPWGLKPYMQDMDRFGGGQHDYDPKLDGDVDLDF